MITTGLTAVPHREDGGLFFLDETDPSLARLDSSVLAALAPAVTSITGAHEIVTIANPKRPRGWRARLSGALRAARELAETLRGACAWLTSGTAADVRRRVYAGRHRLTPGEHRRAPRTGALTAREPRSEEAALPGCDRDALVSWITAALEAGHRLREAQRGSAHVEWLCS